MKRIQIKVCGLTEAKTAQACAALGIDAVGLVFYAKSPRFVSDSRAAEIAAAVAGKVAVVGVFVDEASDVIMEKVRRCHLTAVQLHGQEPPADITRLKHAGLTVIKGLFQAGEPTFDRTDVYDPTAFLVECGRGRLPGGNARTWDWSATRRIQTDKPLIIAGGLSPANVDRAISLGQPDAVDVSSGVETAPGIKDLDRIKAFLAAVRGTAPTGANQKARRIFQ
ncbi:MAG: phosphoribosylanthranilate isomerase [Desulfobacterales bacterium]